MQDFRNLKVWQKAHELALLTYRITADFPREEIFGLRHSMRKMATDIPALVAEGAGRANDNEYAASLGAAFASGMRLDYHALLAHDLKLLADEIYSDYGENLAEVKKMLSGLKKSLKQSG
jgi:four helix bundle protein